MPENLTSLLLIAAAVLIGAVVVWILIRLAIFRLKRWLWMLRHEDAEMVAVMLEGQIARGMTLDMVLDVWGDPADMEEVVLKTKSRRQLKYDQTGKNRYGTRVYLEEDIVVGWETK